MGCDVYVWSFRFGLSSFVRGKRAVFVLSDIRETTAPVSISMHNDLLFTSNITLYGPKVRLLLTVEIKTSSGSASI